MPLVEDDLVDSITTADFKHLAKVLNVASSK
jgi:hypothetical protein